LLIPMKLDGVVVLVPFLFNSQG